MHNRRGAFWTGLWAINSAHFFPKDSTGPLWGRVQSVAVRLVVDREEEIRKFVPKEYWTIDAKMIPKGSVRLSPATFYGDENGKIEIENKEQADRILAELEGADYKISKLKRERAANLRRRRLSPPRCSKRLPAAWVFRPAAP